MPDTTVPLASGGSVTVTRAEARITGPAGEFARAVPLDAIARVATTSDSVKLVLAGGASVDLTAASPADAERLHAALQAAVDQPQRGAAPAPVFVAPHARLQAKTYDKEAHFLNDIGRMDADGWRVVSSAVFQPRSGWARILISFGWLAVVYPPKPQLVVSYERREPAPPAS